MYFGVDYYPEQWVFPYGGTAENPEGAWERDAELMAKAGFNVVRIGEFTWGLCEPEDGKYDFSWLRRVMDIMGEHDIQVVLGTPTAAPPIWLARQHPEILPVDERGLVKHEGTRRAVCLNSDVYWNYSKRIVENMARELGDHPQLIAWQIDNGLGGHFTEASFNEDTRRDWAGWLEAKYETIERLNERLGLRHWGQIVSAWNRSADAHGRADRCTIPRSSSPGAVFAATPSCNSSRCRPTSCAKSRPTIPVTTNLRALRHRFDHFDLAEALDFVSIESTAAIKAKPADIACEIDMLRSLKKSGIRTPDGDTGFWVMEQKAGNVSWQDVNSLVRPGVLRMFTYQLDFARRDGRAVFPLAAAAHRHRKIPRRRPAAQPRRQPPRVRRNLPTSARNSSCSRPALKDTKRRRRSLHPLLARQRLGAATAEPAEQILQPARAHPAHLQRAARPQHPGGFRAARPRICRNTKSSSRRRCICFPAARPTG